MKVAQTATEGVTKAITQQSNVTPIFKNKMDQLSATLENTNAKLELQREKLAELKTEGAGISETSIVQMQKLEKQSMGLESQIREVTARLKELKANQAGGLGNFQAELVTEEIKQVESTLEGLISKADETGAKMADLQAKMDLDGGQKLSEKILNTEATILRLSQSAKKTSDSIQKMNSTMDRTEIAVEEVSKEVKQATKEVRNMGNQFTRAFKRILKQVFVFALIYKGLRSIQQYMTDSLKTNKDFTAALNSLRANLLIAFQPIYEWIVPALTTLIQTLARATQYIAAFVSGLFGRTYSESLKAAKGLQQAKKAVDAYGKAAKNAAGVAAFDELNLIGESADTGMDAIDFDTGAEDNISALDRVSEAMSKATEKAREMAENVKASYGSMSAFISTHSDIIIAALAGVGVAFGLAFGAAKWGAMLATVQRIGAAIGAVLAGISLPITLIIAAVAGLVAGFVYFYRTNESFRDTVHNILSGIGEVAVWLWESVLKPFGAWLADVMVKAWEIVGISATWLWQNVLKPFGDWLAKVMPIAIDAVVKAATWLWKNVMVPFGEFLIWIWNNALVPLGKILTDVLGVAFKFVADIAVDLWKKVLVPLGKSLKEMLAPAVEALSAVMSYLWKMVLKPLAAFIKAILVVALKALVVTFEFLWHDVLEPLARYVGGAFKNVLSGAFQSVGEVVGGIKDIFIGLMNFITGVFTGDWAKAWEGVKQIFKGVFDGLWGIVKYPLNLVIDGINTLIGGLSKIKFDIPDWVPALGGKSFGINIPKIPSLDVGTNYVAQDGLAYLHKGEAVVPQRYNPAAGGGFGDEESTGLLREILQAIRSGNGDLILQVGTTELARIVINGINEISRRTGTTPLRL